MLAYDDGISPALGSRESAGIVLARTRELPEELTLNRPLSVGYQELGPIYQKVSFSYNRTREIL